MTDRELILEIEAQKALMTAVATGGPKIQYVNSENYKKGTGTFLSTNIRWMKHCFQDLNYRAKLDNLHVQT
jgi:hypothetical protein